MMFMLDTQSGKSSTMSDWRASLALVTMTQTASIRLLRRTHTTIAKDERRQMTVLQFGGTERGAQR